jgi:hypothetical protein
MSNLTAKQVEDALEAVVDEKGESINYVWDELNYYIDSPLVVDGDEYPFEVVEQDGSGSWGYETSTVFKVGDQLFRKTGYYQSHYGNDWDGPLREVREGAKTVRVWEDV